MKVVNINAVISYTSFLLSLVLILLGLLLAERDMLLRCLRVKLPVTELALHHILRRIHRVLHGQFFLRITLILPPSSAQRP